MAAPAGVPSSGLAVVYLHSGTWSAFDKDAWTWLQHHAALDVDPDRVVVAGDRPVAAYAPEDPALTPAELASSDPRVCGVVSLYGQADLAAHYDHTGQQKSCRPDAPQPDWDAPRQRGCGACSARTPAD